jgi:hypothetical protein
MAVLGHPLPEAITEANIAHGGAARQEHGSVSLAVNLAEHAREDRVHFLEVVVEIE